MSTYTFRRFVERIKKQPVTEREKQVWLRVYLGWTTRQIGINLGISTATADNHCRNLRYKLGGHNGADLTRKWVDRGMNKEAGRSLGGRVRG